MRILSKQILTDKVWQTAFQSPELATQTGWQSITYGNGIYLARGAHNTKYLSTSTDGINWSAPYEVDLSDPYGSFRFTNNVAYGNGVFVAVGTSDSYVSTDAINWSKVTSTGVSIQRGINLIFDGEKFIAIDTQLQQLWTSTNGTNWEVTGTYGGFANASYIAFDGNKYVINGQNGLMITSTDLINWTETRPTGITPQFTSAMYMGYDGSRFFGIYNGQISYSTDGINWTTPITDSNLGAFWVASTTNDIKTVLISSDGYISTKRV